MVSGVQGDCPAKSDRRVCEGRQERAWAESRRATEVSVQSLERDTRTLSGGGEQSNPTGAKPGPADNVEHPAMPSPRSEATFAQLTPIYRATIWGE